MGNVPRFWGVRVRTVEPRKTVCGERGRGGGQTKKGDLLSPSPKPKNVTLFRGEGGGSPASQMMTHVQTLNP